MSKLSEISNFNNLNPTVLMTHGEQSLCEVVANYDPKWKEYWQVLGFNMSILSQTENYYLEKLVK